jgi:hypothetical protein
VNDLDAGDRSIRHYDETMPDRVVPYPPDAARLREDGYRTFAFRVRPTEPCARCGETGRQLHDLVFDRPCRDPGTDHCTMWGTGLMSEWAHRCCNFVSLYFTVATWVCASCADLIDPGTVEFEPVG